MGRRYKKSLEIEWEGKSLSDIKRKTLDLQTDRNLTNVIKGRFKRRLK